MCLYAGCIGKKDHVSIASVVREIRYGFQLRVSTKRYNYYCPTGSMYGIFTHVWLVLTFAKANVDVFSAQPLTGCFRKRAGSSYERLIDKIVNAHHNQH